MFICDISRFFFWRTLGDIGHVEKTANRGRGLERFVESEKHAWEMEGSASARARWMSRLGLGNGMTMLREAI